MADKLTPQQQEAVQNRGGNLLVSAAAGSGKTKVLVDRLLMYLMDPMDPADLDSFLIITYTKAAALELRGKIAAKLSQRIAEQPENKHLQKQMQRLFLTKISTVHGFCSDLLREYAYKLDLPADFRVADENECREIRETVLSDLLDRQYSNIQEDPDFRAFVDTQGLGRNDKLVPELIEKVYNSAKCHMDPEEWLQKCLKNGDVSEISDASQTTWGAYLMEDLFAYLECQIRVIDQCIQLSQASDGFEKPTQNLKALYHQLDTLRNCKTWDDISAKRNLEYGRLTFPRKNPDPELSERIKAARNACKKGLEKKLACFSDSSEQIIKDLLQANSGARGLIALVHQFDEAYSQAKKSRHVLDFNDLEHKTLDLLLGKSRSHTTAVVAEIGSRFREIMVDEYQDSNAVQDAIFSALTGQRHNCFMVGDVKQSIYQFRLADPEIFLDKYKHFLPAERAKTSQDRKALLSHNFRSGGEIVEAVNDVFSSCMRPAVGGLLYGEEEALREGIPHESLPDAAVELYALEIREDTYPEEASFVADRIQAMLKEGTLVRGEKGFRPVQPEDIVILLRSPGSVGSYFQRALEARGIRCSSGGGMDLLQTQEIGTFRSFLQVILNPRQDIPLISTLASPLFGFTADELAEIRSNMKKGSVYDALLESEKPKVLSFLKLLSDLRREAQMNTLTHLLERCFLLTRMDSIYGAMAGGDAKQANLQTFFQLAVEFEKGSLRDLGQFLDHIQALEGKGLISAGNNTAGAVTIMSIHKSKGLEFPVVFLCGLSRSFNRESLQAQILCDKNLGIGLSVVDPKNRIRYPSIAKRAIATKMICESISEEMRVLYVAMTRSRDRLIMTYAARNLEADLSDIAMRMDFDRAELLCREAICPGDWVLIAAMQHTEAGNLHAVGGKPQQTKIGAFPWHIAVMEAPESQMEICTQSDSEIAISEDTAKALMQKLSFSYKHMEATLTPSKQTATGRKGRVKDAEAAEKSEEPKEVIRAWRKPSFRRKEIEGKAYGNALHAAMQYIRYDRCSSVESVKEEIAYLVSEGFLTKEQGDLVSCEQISAFFATPIGSKLRSGTPHLREFKFSILDSGSNYGENLEGEQVLLQGVVDCALLEPDGIVVLDFKTDYVTEDTLPQAVERYRLQVNTYAEALSRIFEMPIKEQYLYFFRRNVFCSVK